MKVVIFGLSITSSWGNGHASTFRALCRALYRRGHRIVFFEHNVKWYESNRDLPEPHFCDVCIFEDWKSVLPRVRKELHDADVAMVGSYFPDIQAIELVLDRNIAAKAFYDIDTPITLSKLRAGGEAGYLKSSQIAGFDVYFSFTGGPILEEIKSRFGAKKSTALYCCFDRERYHPLPVNKRFACDLSYMGTYASDRQPKIDELVRQVAEQLSDKKFIVAGPMYPRRLRWPRNVKRRNHLSPQWHPHLYCSSRITLNITRREMVLAGYSPSVRLFEAAACGTCIASDTWPGLETFFLPGKEVLVPTGTADMVHYLKDFDDDELRRIGRNARERVLAEHSSAKRAQEFEAAVEAAIHGTDEKAISSV